MKIIVSDSLFFQHLYLCREESKGSNRTKKSIKGKNHIGERSKRKEQRDTYTIAVATCTVLGTVDTGVKKAGTQKLLACVEFALTPEETHNEMMTE